MTLQKIVAITSAAAMLLSFAGVSFAKGYDPKPTPAPTTKITVTNVLTVSKTVAVANVSTGNNTQMGGLFTAPKLTTGSVSSVSAGSNSGVNTTILPSCGCTKGGTVTVTNSFTTAKTVAAVNVGTGDNTQLGGSTATTGSVSGVSAGSISTVNYTDLSVE